jgi:hypothetical protein
MSEKKDTTPRRARNTNSFHQRARDIEALFNLPDLNHDAEEVSLQLTEMAAWLINNSENGGALARAIYLAIGRTWEENRAAADHDERERQTCNFHKQLLEELETVQGDPTLKERMAEIEAEAETVAVPQNNEPMNLNLWRQSHARPIKRCIVDVKGGA